MIKTRASIVFDERRYCVLTEEELGAALPADSSALRPFMPKFRCLTDKKEGRKSQGGQRDLAGERNLDWTRIQGKDWTNIKPELSNAGSAGLHSLPFTVLKKKKKTKKGGTGMLTVSSHRLWNEAVKQLRCLV